MNRLRPILVIATLAGTLLAASTASAEKEIYGQKPVAVSNTMNCAAEASLALGAYLIYQTGEPIDKALPIAMGSASAKADPKNAERRLREIYTAKPTQPTTWARQVFQSCLAMKVVPVDYARSGNCYMLSYYLAAVVPLYKSQGMDNAQILAEVVPGKAEPAFIARVRGLVAEYAARSNADARKNNISDTGRFLQCVSPTQPAVSNR
ncbi:MAG: hypothetical protein ACREO3_02370 [Arenimonas sp.]